MHWDEFWRIFREQLATTDWLQWTVIIFGVAEVLLARVNNILLYPAGIISSFVTIYILYDQRLYADGLLNAYYVAMSVYGWWYWTRKRDQPPVPISWTTKREWGIVCIIAGAGFVILYESLRRFTNSTTPAWDAWAAAVAWAGTWLLARRKIENWLVLNISNLFYIPLLLYKKLPLLAGLTIILFIVAVVGYFDWSKRFKTQTA